MDFEIKFEPKISESAGSRLVLTVGDALIRSYPMSPEDHYRDLFALKRFLAQRTLVNIVLGDEPVAEVEFLGIGDLAALRPYSRPGTAVFSEEFSLSQALDQIDRTLLELSAIIASDRDLVERQANADIDAGVYDSCVDQAKRE